MDIYDAALSTPGMARLFRSAAEIEARWSEVNHDERRLETAKAEPVSGEPRPINRPPTLMSTGDAATVSGGRTR